jgi:hypothetical protein
MSSPKLQKEIPPCTNIGSQEEDNFAKPKRSLESENFNLMQVNTIKFRILDNNNFARSTKLSNLYMINNPIESNHQKSDNNK